MKNLMIPQLHCPFISKLNCHVEAVKQHTDQWVNYFNLYDQEGIGKYYSDNYAYFTARFYPEANFKELCVANDLISLLFAIDDKIDSSEINKTIKTEEALQKFVGKFLSTINQKINLNILESDSVFNALKDVWHRLSEISDKEFMISFVKEIEHIFEATIWEQKNSSNKILPSVTEYLEKRKYIGAANITLAIIEPIAKIQLPEFLKQSQEIRNLDHSICNSICISNDLFSLSKEQVSGDVHNLPSIIKNEYNISWEKAISLTAEIHDAEIKKVINLSEELNKKGNKILESYINILKEQLAGNFIWSEFETERYQFTFANN